VSCKINRYDGTTGVAEVFAIVVRWINIVQRLIRLGLYKHSSKTEHLVQVLNECLTLDLGLPYSSVLAFQYDRTVTNNAAVDPLRRTLATWRVCLTPWIMRVIISPIQMRKSS
jgi:hypothetical protein